jgi:uncharacterized protein
MDTSLVEPIEDFDPRKLPDSTITGGWLTVPIGLDGRARLPVMVARGSRPGPTALLVAGVHGDEFEGIVALSRVMGSLQPASMAGTVITLPVCNPFAFRAQSRATSVHIDGANLARVFPGDANGTPTARLAWALFAMATRLLGPSDLMVDLHSAGSRYRYLGLVGFRDVDGPARRSSEEAARHFGLAKAFRLWAIPPQRGMFNAETTLAGIPTVAAEAPGQGQCTSEDVERYADGARNLLRFKGIMPGDAPPSEPGPASRPLELVASVDGVLVTEHTVGDRVDEGERVGTILDIFGAMREEVRASKTGELWALRTFATVYTGEMVAWIV